MNKSPQTAMEIETPLSEAPSPLVPQISRGIDWIEEMAGALTDPIIVYPAPGWMDALPEPLLKRLSIERLLYLNLCIAGKAKIEESLDIEAVLYMYPRTMVAPMPSEWNRIYLYLGTKVIGEACPDDIKEKELSNWEMGLLRDFKRWLHSRKVKARKERGKMARATPPATEKPASAIVPEKYEQTSFL